jgi:hypothetical protein
LFGANQKVNSHLLPDSECWVSFCMSYIKYDGKTYKIVLNYMHIFKVLLKIFMSKKSPKMAFFVCFKKLVHYLGL